MVVYKRIKIGREYFRTLHNLATDLGDLASMPLYEVEITVGANPQDELEHAEALASLLKDRIDDFVEDTHERCSADEEN